MSSPVTQVQNKIVGPRLNRFLESLRALATQLYAAHGGWDAARAARMNNFIVTRG
jgi:hypothetical protein